MNEFHVLLGSEFTHESWDYIIYTVPHRQALERETHREHIPVEIHTLLQAPHDVDADDTRGGAERKAISMQI